MTKIKNECSRVVAKLSPLLIGSEQTLKDPDMKNVPYVMHRRLKDLSTKLTNYQNEAREKLAVKTPLDMTFCSADLAPLVKDAVQTRNLVQNMLNNVRQLL